MLYIPTFLLAWYFFSDDILSRIYLKNNNTKLQATIAGIETKRRNNLELLLIFIYDNKKHEKKVVISNSFIKSYHVGKEITVLYNDEKNLVYPNDNVNESIIRAILFLIVIVPLLCSSAVYFLIFDLIDRIKKMFNRDKEIKKTFEIYKQDNEYNVVTIFTGKFITLEIIMKYMDLHELRNKNLLCYGIGAGKNFIEIYYNDQQYSIRISKNKNEYEENIDGDVIIKYYEKVMEEIGNGA